MRANELDYVRTTLVELSKSAPDLNRIVEKPLLLHLCVPSSLPRGRRRDGIVVWI